MGDETLGIQGIELFVDHKLRPYLMKLSLSRRSRYRLSVTLFTGIVVLLLVMLTNSHQPHKITAGNPLRRTPQLIE